MSQSSEELPFDGDLSQIAAELRDMLDENDLLGYAHGKTLMRDALVERHSCSLLMAEELVDTLERMGFVECLHEVGGLAGSPGSWRFRNVS